MNSNLKDRLNWSYLHKFRFEEGNFVFYFCL
jgi:hypothetical protein